MAGHAVLPIRGVGADRREGRPGPGANRLAGLDGIRYIRRHDPLDPGFPPGWIPVGPFRPAHRPGLRLRDQPGPHRDLGGPGGLRRRRSVARAAAGDPQWLGQGRADAIGPGLAGQPGAQSGHPKRRLSLSGHPAGFPLRGTLLDPGGAVDHGARELGVLPLRRPLLRRALSDIANSHPLNGCS